MKNMVLQRKMDYSIDLLRKAEKMALEYDNINGFYLAFSGGKDSQVIYHLAKEAGVKFKAHMNLTSVDPPEVIRFVSFVIHACALFEIDQTLYCTASASGSNLSQLVRMCLKIAFSVLAGILI